MRGNPRRQQWLLFRRGVSDRAELAYYVVSATQRTSPEEIVRVAGNRRAIEESFESANGEVGPDHYEARIWDVG